MHNPADLGEDSDEWLMAEIRRDAVGPRPAHPAHPRWRREGGREEGVASREGDARGGRRGGGDASSVVPCWCWCWQAAADGDGMADADAWCAESMVVWLVLVLQALALLKHAG